MAKPLPRICLVALGGTIASVPPASGGGAVPSLDAAAIAAGIPGVGDIADLELRSFRQLPGAHLSTGDLIALAELARALAAEGVAGMVVTQGTDTIEETAFALDLLAGDALPIVVTGAMRGPAEISADGPANLLAAIRVAAGGATAGLGAIVVMDDTLHAGRWVRKLHSSRPSAFGSPATGPLGWITENRVTIAWRPRRSPVLKPVSAEPIRRVALVSTWLGDDGRLVRAAVDTDYAGLVVQAVGGGHVNAPVADAIGDAAARIPVVFASRVGNGETLRGTYGFTGSETDLIRRGAIPAGPLDATKARLLLELLLSRPGRPVADVARYFGYFADGSDTCRRQ